MRERSTFAVALIFAMVTSTGVADGDRQVTGPPALLFPRQALAAEPGWNDLVNETAAALGFASPDRAEFQRDMRNRDSIMDGFFLESGGGLRLPGSKPATERWPSLTRPSNGSHDPVPWFELVFTDPTVHGSSLLLELRVSGILPRARPINDSADAEAEARIIAGELGVPIRPSTKLKVTCLEGRPCDQSNIAFRPTVVFHEAIDGLPVRYANQFTVYWNSSGRDTWSLTLFPWFELPTAPQNLSESEGLRIAKDHLEAGWLSGSSNDSTLEERRLFEVRQYFTVDHAAGVCRDVELVYSETWSYHGNGLRETRHAPWTVWLQSENGTVVHVQSGPFSAPSGPPPSVVNRADSSVIVPATLVSVIGLSVTALALMLVRRKRKPRAPNPGPPRPVG